MNRIIVRHFWSAGRRPPRRSLVPSFISNSERLLKPPPLPAKVALNPKNWDEFAHFQTVPVRQEVAKYIDAENLYCEAQQSQWLPLQRRVLRELQEVMHQPDAEEPEDHDPSLMDTGGGYAYFYSDGVYYRQSYDSAVAKKAPRLDEDLADVLLDTNTLEANTSIANMSISCDHSTMAYLMKHVGEEDGTLWIQSLNTADEKVSIRRVVNFVWSTDGTAILYTKMNRQLRPNRVFIRRLSNTQSAVTEKDQLLFMENDERFFVDISKTKDKRFICINSNSRSCSEVSLVDAEFDFRQNDSLPALKLVCKRQPGIEYYVDHHKDHFYIVTNALGDGIDFRIVSAPSHDPSSDNWKQIMDMDEHTKIEDVDILNDHLIIYAKRYGLSVILIHEVSSNSTHQVDVPEKISTIIPGVNRDFDASSFRFTSVSAGKREIAYEYGLDSNSLHMKRTVPINGFDRDQYRVYRYNMPLPETLCRQDDLPNILPITIIHKKGVQVPQCIGHESNSVFSTKSDESNGGVPDVNTSSTSILLQSYNAYGMETGLPFDPIMIPLLQRDWILISCHGPGGNEFGKGWYRRGMGALNKHKVTQEIKYLVSQLETTSATPTTNIHGLGVSAGGCIMGSVFGQCWNQGGDSTSKANSFSSMVLHVPFLDPIAAMRDPYAALTTVEHEEWGNPAQNSQDLEIMKRSSPLELIPDGMKLEAAANRRTWPSIFVTTGLKDQRVPFWHPLKWTARMRDRLAEIYGSEASTETAWKLLLLARKEAGHFGDTSDSTLEDAAWWISFLINENEARKLNSSTARPSTTIP